MYVVCYFFSMWHRNNRSLVNFRVLSHHMPVCRLLCLRCGCLNSLLVVRILLGICCRIWVRRTSMQMVETVIFRRRERYNSTRRRRVFVDPVSNLPQGCPASAEERPFGILSQQSFCRRKGLFLLHKDHISAPVGGNDSVGTLGPGPSSMPVCGRATTDRQRLRTRLHRALLHCRREHSRRETHSQERAGCRQAVFPEQVFSLQLR